jgi:predicted metalloprotease with PDZ domain
MKICISLGLLVIPLLAQEPVRYEIRFPNAIHHEAEIRATFSDVHQPVLEVMMSRSSPGRYALHEFAKSVTNFKASDAQGHALEVTRPTPYQWNVAGAKGVVVVEYTLFGDRADGTYAGIDTTHAHLNPPATFVWAHGFEKNPVAIRIAVPDGSDWKVATQLAPQTDGTWTAPNMDRMMDATIEISRHNLLSWKVGETQFYMSLHHQGTDEEAAAYAKMAEAVTAEEEGVFGAFPKYDNGSYTFLIDYLPYVNGDGMEHRNSTSITGTNNLRTGGANAIGTVAHEYFHNWNVKRIRPKTLEPFDFERANMSGELWFAEGFTNYYGPLTLRRAGLSSLDRFTRGMAGAVSSVLTAPGRLVFNVIDMSRQAPFVDAAVSIDPTNTVNNFISYYTYGEALALGIDLEIRSRFPGKSLDDWMRQMWKEHPDSNKPYTLDDLQSTLATVTSKDFAAAIFKRHIYGKEPMDYASLLANAGLLLEKRTGTGANRVWTGVQFGMWSDQGMTLNQPTLRGSPIYDVGLDRGDRIVECDGKAPKTQQELDAILARHKPGDKIHLRAETRSGRREVDIVLAEPPGFQITPYELAGKELTPAMAKFREAWLSSKAVHPLPKLSRYCPVCRRVHPFEFDNCPFDGAALRITPPKPGDDEAEGDQSGAPAGGRGGRGGRGGPGGGGQ